MNVFNLFELNGFTAKVLSVTVIVAAAELILKKFGKKLPAFLVNYIPPLLAFLGEFTACCIINGKAEINDATLCGGLTAYSLGTLFAGWIRKLFKGEISEQELFSLVKTVAYNLCGEDNAVVSAIIKALKNLSAGDLISAKDDIFALLKKAAKNSVSDKEITTATEQILLSANRIKEK